MANTIFNLDLANLFAGDDDPTAGLFLVMKNVSLPNLQEKKKSFSPSGGIVDMELGMRKIEAPTMSFTVEGVSPDVLIRFMPSQRINYTLRANVRDVAKQEDIAVRAIINGRMTQANIGQLTAGEGVETEYQISEIMRYQLFWGNEEKFFFDAFAGPAGLRINGVMPYGQIAANLGIV